MLLSIYLYISHILHITGLGLGLLIEPIDSILKYQLTTCIQQPRTCNIFYVKSFIEPIDVYTVSKITQAQTTALFFQRCNFPAIVNNRPPISRAAGSNPTSARRPKHGSTQHQPRTTEIHNLPLPLPVLTTVLSPRSSYLHTNHLRFWRLQKLKLNFLSKTVSSDLRLIINSVSARTPKRHDSHLPIHRVPTANPQRPHF